MNNKFAFTAILEPASTGFRAKIEELPAITTTGPKIAGIKKELLKKLATHQNISQDQIMLTISVRVEID
ncbi:hypothetical protein [Microscilla marina]|uniref:Uncharacterized protein n=1 Tax=Microscilla marina ATCC 23134 TaxID=313606 RepID=A1ZH68_MICM2|nr:hypothetical protein [Microscilla marina]EAY30338.1 hypothetical protein M23134_08167 [Microscilla marina ATCC 23134]